MRSEKGFTLIELLVVILIIAILAAVAIPVFLKQREKGWAAQVESALKNTATAVESYYVDKGSYESLNAEPQLETRLGPQGWSQPEWAIDDDHANVSRGINIRADADSYCIYIHHLRMPSTNPWHQATYESGVGAPRTEPDDCSGFTG